MRTPQRMKSAVIWHLWTYAEAVNTLPYLRAVVRSLREHWLEMQLARLKVRRVHFRPGLPDRHDLILREDLGREAKLAQARFGEVVTEMMMLDIYPLDALGGLALIPFRQGDALAWFVFDLFSPEGLTAWRFDADALETRRPLAEMSAPALANHLPGAVRGGAK